MTNVNVKNVIVVIMKKKLNSFFFFLALNLILFLIYDIILLVEKGVFYMRKIEDNRTLSKNGTVTRGVCKVENEKLKGIYESYKIMMGDDGVIYETVDDGVNILLPETPVSMNMWGFSKDTVPCMVEYLKDFLNNLAPDDNKSECILPIMVGDLMASGNLDVSAFSTNENWFGITYREDLGNAAQELKARHLEGIYPPVLF